MTEINLQELQLAARNHGMPLEALRWDVTPIGLHYLLTHYDIPDVDPAVWQLEVGGHVERPLSLSLDDLRSRPSGGHAVTMECAGNGRARLVPRPVSQPWLHEAVGTMTWTGTPLAGVLADAAPLEGAVLLDDHLEPRTEPVVAADRAVVAGEDGAHRVRRGGQPLGLRPLEHAGPRRLGLVPRPHRRLGLGTVEEVCLKFLELSFGLSLTDRSVGG